MGFFHVDKDIDAKNLKLSDYNQIWTKFCFLDECGSLSDPTQNLFTLGIIKLSQPYYLSSKISYERSKRNFHDELKFNKISKRNIDFYKFAINIFLNTPSSFFYSYTICKKGKYFQNHFHQDPWQAYEELTIRLLTKAVLAPREILILIADYITVPRKVRYEVNVKKEVNSLTGKLSIAGVCRFDSKANDLLQLVDLFIGAINYDINLSLIPRDRYNPYKKEFTDYLKTILGVNRFLDSGFKNKAFNIFVDKDSKGLLL